MATKSFFFVISRSYENAVWQPLSVQPTLSEVLKSNLAVVVLQEDLACNCLKSNLAVVVLQEDLACTCLKRFLFNCCWSEISLLPFRTGKENMKYWGLNDPSYL